MRKTSLLILLFLLSYEIFLGQEIGFAQKQNPLTNYNVPREYESNAWTIVVHNEYSKQTLSFEPSKLLFKVIPHYDKYGNFKSTTMKLDPRLINIYKQVGYQTKSQKVAFVYPIFTQAAYGYGGFYYYYKKVCNLTCLTVPIPNKISGAYESSISAAFVLTLLNYSYVNDIDIDKNPSILKKYDKIIVLHNEYVTKREFDAITSHPNVVYLFPNALYAQVKTDYAANTITLIKGHGYPTASIGNGFGWKYDNTPYEGDFICDTWHFYHILNGKMLNCYPDFKMLSDQSLLFAIKN